MVSVEQRADVTSLTYDKCPYRSLESEEMMKPFLIAIVIVVGLVASAYLVRGQENGTELEFDLLNRSDHYLILLRTANTPGLPLPSPIIKSKEFELDVICIKRGAFMAVAVADLYVLCVAPPDEFLKGDPTLKEKFCGAMGLGWRFKEFRKDVKLVCEYDKTKEKEDELEKQFREGSKQTVKGFGFPVREYQT